jgi:hypothetical protein
MHDFALFVFLVVIVGAFVSLLLGSDNKERTLQKIVGGLSVFVVAILSENPYVTSISLFIGGLIIASEHFMKILVAIMRADSKDIKDLVRVEPATPEEVEQKQVQEEKEVEVVGSVKPSEVKLSEEVVVRSDLSETRKHVERMVSERLMAKFGGKYKSNAKISTRENMVVFDGVIQANESDSVITRRPIAVEIKYIPHLSKSFFAPETAISRVLAQMWSNSRDIRILFVLVGDDLTEEAAASIYKRLRERYARVYFAVYSYNRATESVQELVMDPHVSWRV